MNINRILENSEISKSFVILDVYGDFDDFMGS